MSYRGPQSSRIAAGQADIFTHAGQTATWRAYVSASAGVPVAGMGSAARFVERTVTALFGAVSQAEVSVPAGQIAAGDIYCVMREQVGRNDELRWRGVLYRVESDPAPARIAGTWAAILKRRTP